MRDGDEEDEQMEPPNMSFVLPFDNFCSFGKAAGYIEDWIRTKKNNPTEFTNDLPAIIDRAKLIRRVLLYVRSLKPTVKGNIKPDIETEQEVKNVHKLIYTSDLYPTEGDYLFYFLLNLIESCCARVEVPLLVIRIAWNQLKNLVEDDKVKLTPIHQKFAVERLDKIRAEVVHEFYKHLKLSSLVSPSYFEKMIE
jgi:hypothetical protein